MASKLGNIYECNLVDGVNINKILIPGTLSGQLITMIITKSFLYQIFENISVGLITIHADKRIRLWSLDDGRYRSYLDASRFRVVFSKMMKKLFKLNSYPIVLSYVPVNFSFRSKCADHHRFLENVDVITNSHL